jgi:hypothetical protein
MKKSELIKLIKPLEWTHTGKYTALARTSIGNLHITRSCFFEKSYFVDTLDKAIIEIEKIYIDMILDSFIYK